VRARRVRPPRLPRLHAPHPRRVEAPVRRDAARAGPPAPQGVGVRRRLLRLRSEEHTSELQSLTNLVCRLLLEKKKTTATTTLTSTPQHTRPTSTRSTPHSQNAPTSIKATQPRLVRPATPTATGDGLTMRRTPL